MQAVFNDTGACSILKFLCRKKIVGNIDVLLFGPLLPKSPVKPEQHICSSVHQRYLEGIKA